MDTKKGLKNIEVDEEIEAICERISKASTIEDVYNILNNSRLKKEKIVNIAMQFNVQLLKSYTKTKIIDSIVEKVIGPNGDSI